MSIDTDTTKDAIADGDLKLFLCGDVMTGREIDQILPHPCDPTLHESWAKSALDYVRLAELATGPIRRPVDFPYVWGAALDELARVRPDARIINLETSITRSDAFARKGIHYRMSPENAACLAAAGIDCCVLANNHVIDWGKDGLLDTLSTLGQLRIKTAGAGRNHAQAMAPAVLDIAGKARVLVFSFATATSGTSRSWAATADSPGINFLSGLTDANVAEVADQVARERRPGDIVIVSLHWGANWEYDAPHDQQRFARRLIDRADVSVVHGHSSHHPKAIAVYRNRLIVYGCGDFLNDYEGIEGYDEFRGDLVVMYFVHIDRTNADLVALEMVPLRIRRLQLTRPSREDIHWLAQTLDRECEKFGAHVGMGPGDSLTLSWSA